MRYFKCDTIKQENRQIIAQDIKLTESEMKSNRRGKLLNFIATLLFLIFFLGIFVGCIFMITRIPAPNNPFLFLVLVIGLIILGIGAFLISVIIGGAVSSPIYKKAQDKLIIQKKVYFNKALSSLREYYGWTEPCIVTKCYDATDKKFKKRDVCIFIFDNELRLSADLKHGFSTRENDPGCYAFEINEFSLKQIQGEQFVFTEFRAEKLIFHLGRRAKGFIEKNFF